MNSTEQRFAHIAAVERAAGWMHYRPHTPSAHLLELIKYCGRPRLAQYLGEQMARAASGSDMLEGITAIVPVPLHFLRKARRGYNQSEMLARGLGRVAGVPVVRALRAAYHRTQTALSHTERSQNVAGVYSSLPGVTFPGERSGAPAKVLLVDDVCTTGATLSEAAEALVSAHPGLRLHIYALATTTL